MFNLAANLPQSYIIERLSKGGEKETKMPLFFYLKHIF